MSMDIEEQYDKIYRYCYFRLKEQQTAEDITQETFLRFLENKTYQNTGQTLQYLYTVARNLCIDEYRRKKCVELTEELGEEREDDWVLSITVRQALAELQKEDQELLLLRYVNEVPVSVIGSVLGLSRFAVYRRTKDALKHLREKLGGEEVW